jgi:hypothetical protein
MHVSDLDFMPLAIDDAVVASRVTVKEAVAD